MKLTTRMRWIIKQMKDHNADIREKRDAFLEVSTWWLSWQDDDAYHEHQITERTRGRLIKAGLIERIETTPIYNKSGKFITQERTYTATPNR